MHKLQQVLFLALVLMSRPIALSAQGAGQTYRQWLQQYGLPVDATGLGALNASPASDGFVNTIKFSLGLNPWERGDGGRMLTGIAVEGTNRFLELTYTRPEPLPAGITHEVELSPDLILWSGTSGIQTSNTVTSGLRTITIRDNLPMDGTTSRGFLRLKVSVTATLPVNTAPPVATGVAQLGQTLTAFSGSWAGGTESPSFTYQWKRDGVDIPGATASTYTLIASDVGGAISVRVSGMNIAGSASASSAAVAVMSVLKKANNTTALNLIGSWTTGTVPSVNNIAEWDATLTANKAVVLGTNLSFGGIKVSSGTSTLHTISSGNTLTLGSAGIDMSSAAVDFTISAALDLTAPQTWNVAPFRTLTIGASNTGTRAGALGLTGSGNVRIGQSTAFGSGGVTLGGGINIGSNSITSRTIANDITLNGDIGITSISTTTAGGLGLTGNLVLGSTDRTVLLSCTTGNTNIPTFIIGGGSSKTVSGSGALILANANPGLTPATSVGLTSGMTFQSGLRIKNGVTVFTSASNLLSSAAALTVDAGGTFNLARSSSGSAMSQTVVSISGAGLITSNATTPSSATLTVDGGNEDGISIFSGQITNTAGAGLGLTKSGSTTLVLTGTNTYSGPTIVTGGVLQLGDNAATADFIADAGSKVYLSGEGSLELNFVSDSVQESIDFLYLDGTLQAAGIWGAQESSAPNQSARITGLGLLKVGPPGAPVITTHPASQVAELAANVTFSVVAASNPAPAYQWKKDGIDIGGATSPSLTLINVTAADAASYTVVVSNTLGVAPSNAAILAVNSSPNVVNVVLGPHLFSWTFDQPVTHGYFIDGQPWVVMPSGGSLYLTAATPSRLNNQAVKVFVSSSVSAPINADINITVKNPPLDHTYNGTTYVDNANGVFGWDSRTSSMPAAHGPKYNSALGWDGTTPLALTVGDSITTPKSIVADLMPNRSTPLDSLAVLTVLNAIPPADAFRPGVIRSGTDRTNPEILRYSDLIDLSPYLIASPLGTADLRGVNVTSIAPQYTFDQISACLPGPGFVNTGNSPSEGASALLNTYAIPYGGVYGGTIGGYMGQLAIGSLASWLTEDQRKFCRIRYIQRAIDSYTAVKAGLCLEESAGILPGYSTLITTAGVMLNHSGMKSVNNGVNGVKPWWIFADYACHFHTDGVPSSDLATGETQTDRFLPLYSATTTNYPELNKKDVQPVAAATSNTMTMRTDFLWGGGRPIYNIINLKVKITGGPGAGNTIYVITSTITDGVADEEKFRTTPTGTLYPGGGGNVYGYLYGGKVGVKPAWQNGIPDATSVLSFSITASDTDNDQSDNASWYWNVGGVKPVTVPAILERVKGVCTSPIAEYASVHSGGTIDNLIALYALGQQNLYKGGVDKYLIQAGTRPGYGEKLFTGTYLNALGYGTSGNMRGALWKQKVLTPLGKPFVYTGQGTSALDVPHTHAKMWYEP